MTRVMQVGLIVLAVLLAVATSMAWSRGNEIKTLNDSLTSVTTERDKLQAEKTLREKSAAINESVGVSVALGIRDKTNAFANVYDRQQDQIASIELKYQDIPVTPESQAAKSREISEVRIDSMWASYCIAQPQAVECQPAKQ
jgi:hypothetical protein